VYILVAILTQYQNLTDLRTDRQNCYNCITLRNCRDIREKCPVYFLLGISVLEFCYNTTAQMLIPETEVNFTNHGATHGSGAFADS